MAIPSVTEIMNHFVAAFNPGRDVLVQEANWILLRLTAIELAVAGIVWGVNGSNIAAELFKKAFIITTFFYVINHYNIVTKTVADGFVQAGENAALAASPERGLITNPDRIFNAATNAVYPIAQKLSEVGWSDMLTINTIMLGLALLLTMLAFMVLGAQVFITYLEYYLVTTLAILFLPFGVFRKTAFLAERVFQSMISFGVRMMMLSFLLAVTLPILERTSMSQDPTWQMGFQLFFVSLVLVALSLHAPSVAAGLLTGAASLGFADFGRTAMGAGVGAVTTPAATVVRGRDGASSAVGTAVGGAAKRAAEVAAAGGTPHFGTKLRGATTAIFAKEVLGSPAYRHAQRPYKEYLNKESTSTKATTETASASKRSAPEVNRSANTTAKGENVEARNAASDVKETLKEQRGDGNDQGKTAPGEEARKNDPSQAQSHRTEPKASTDNTNLKPIRKGKVENA